MKKVLGLLLVASLNANAYEESYVRLGQEHGCESGNHIGGSSFSRYQKDKSYYNAYPEYAEAWDIAFERCKIQKIEQLRMITDSLNRGW